jgi:signal peptidase I
MGTPWVSPEPEPEAKGLFSGKNLQVAGASIALPGSGHLVRGKFWVGFVWTLFSLTFYAAIIFFRVAQDAHVFFVMGVAAFLLSCAAVYACCVRGVSDTAGRKLGFLGLTVIFSAIWVIGTCHLTALAAGFRYFTVPSRSMEPTIIRGDSVLVDMRYFRDHKPQNGDIIVAQDQKLFGDQPILKVARVSGVAGDTVEMVNGKLIRNGVPVEENYVMHSGDPPAEYLRNMPARTIPPSQLFLLGDSRDNSFDSRAPEVGNYFESELRGKFVRKVWWPWKSRPQATGDRPR